MKLLLCKHCNAPLTNPSGESVAHFEKTCGNNLSWDVLSAMEHLKLDALSGGVIGYYWSASKSGRIITTCQQNKKGLWRVKVRNVGTGRYRSSTAETINEAADKVARRFR